MRSTAYKLLASAFFADARIERLARVSNRRRLLRFSGYRGAMFAGAMVISEDELLVLIGDAIAARVFSTAFVSELLNIVEGAS